MHHPVVVSAPRGIARQRQPWLLQRSDDDFIAATLDDLRSSDGMARLRGLRPQTANERGTLKLFQPIQRQFHVALIEAWCDMPGEPRIDPAKVEAAGLVLRRVARDGSHEGWMRSNGRIRGWVSLSRVGGPSADPAALPRLQRSGTGVADIDRQLHEFAQAHPDSALEEQVIPLYIAPPEVCGAAAKTLYYGIVPTISSELCEQPATFGTADGVDFGPRSTAFRNHLVEALRGEAMSLPSPGEQVTRDWLVKSAPADPTAPAPSLELVRFVLLLRQLGTEFDAFGAEGSAIRNALHALQLPLVLREGETVARTVAADTFLANASTVVLGQTDIAGGVEMPAMWPAMATPDAQRLADALHAAMQLRFAAMKGKSGRFDEPDARYVLRAFVRLKAEGACPSRVVWSDATDPFVIAPWYEGAGAPPVQIPLPDPNDKGLLKALKPNVAFVVPPSLQSLLSGSSADLMGGKGKSSGLGLTWICAFNIPIITICAFISLNIILSLFNLIFGWMFAMKICLPFPKIAPKE